MESCALVAETSNPPGTLRCTESCPGLKREVKVTGVETGVFRCASVCGPAEMLDETSAVCVRVCPRGTRADGRECLRKCFGGREPDENGRCEGLRARVGVWAVSGWTVVGLAAAGLVLIPIVCLARSPRRPRGSRKVEREQGRKRGSKKQRKRKERAQEMAPTQTMLRGFDEIVRDARAERTERIQAWGRGQARLPARMQ